MNDNKNKEISGLDDFFDDDPTDELPVLNLRDIDPELAERFDDESHDDTGEHERPDIPAPPAPVLEAAAGVGESQADLSLHQMELEIQALQSNWHEIEDEVRSRDEFIEGLEDELRSERAALGALQAELDAAHAELEKANEECARLTAENAEQSDAAEAQEQRLQSAQAEAIEQRVLADELRQERDELLEELTRVADVSAELEAANLQQQNDAESLSERLSAAEEQLLEETNRADSLQEDLVDARQKLTEIESNSARLTADHGEQLQIAADQARQIEKLQAASVELRVQSDDLANYIAGRKSDWDALHAEHALQTEANASLQHAIVAKSESLESQKRENAALLAEINDERANSARRDDAASANADALAEELALRRELEAKLSARTQDSEALEAATARLSDVEAAQHTLNDELSDKNREIDRLNKALAELEAEHAESVAALKKQREIIQHMEDEVRSRLEAIAVIGRSAQRKKGKPASIHRLEVVRSDKSAGTRAPDSGRSERMMIALKGARQRKYRIEQGTMTIGRGKENDIRLRHHFISRYHAQILTDADGSIIEDLGSKNGVLVNAEPVDRRRLQDGDLVDIGEMQFKFIDPFGPPDEHKTH